MKPYFGMSFNPSDYAWELVNRLGFKEPPINWVDVVLEDLGLKRKSYSGARFFPGSEEPQIAQSAGRQLKLFGSEAERPAFTRQQQRPIEAALWNREIIFVDADYPPERQHLAICHEIGHYCLPWHEELTFLKDGCIVEPTGTKKWYELEALRFAADLLMPPPFFREDMHSLPFGLESVEELSDRYLTSLEATARHYVDLSPTPCALVIVGALPKGTTTKDGASLKVRYSHGSRSFNHFIRPGTEVGSASPITQASLGWSGLTITDEVPGSVLGLRPERRLILHCRSWGKEGDVLVLVEERQGNQGTLL